MNAANSEIAAAHNLRRSGNRHIGPCPQCGGSKDSDKFVLFADGGFRCFACGWKGDRIKWLRVMENMSCRQAHDAIGKDCSTSCPNYGPCRNGEPVKRRPRSVRPLQRDQQSGLAILSPTLPSPTWTSWAEELLQKAQANLAKEQTEINWLASRGIDAAQVDRAQLGWLSHDQRVDKGKLGLPTENGNDRQWVPGGLVIPIFDAQGQLHRLRIRRTPASRERFLSDRKYVWIKGSGNRPMVLRPAGQVRGAVIVEAELDAIAVAASHPEVLVVALGTVAGGIDAELKAELTSCPVILVALDADPAKDGKLGAGPAAVKRWRATFRQARFWPMPQGKDPGDYVRDHDGDLKAWVESGLPPVITPAVSSNHVEKQELPTSAPARQDSSFSPERCSTGGRGKSSPSLEVAEIDNIVGFADLLKQEAGGVWYGPAPHGELVVRFRHDPQNLDAFQRRGRITKIMYGGGAVADLLEVIPRGQYIGADALVQLQQAVCAA